MDWMVLGWAMVAAYLLGSVPFAVLVSRAMGLKDPRTFGSGNPGATNVLRSGSKAAAVATLVLDAAKGWLPVALVGWYGGAAYGLWEEAQALVGLAAFAGHVWPVFLRFKGGKGVATALGVLLGLSPWLGLGVLLVWIVVLLLFRRSSLASIVAAVLAPVLYLLGGGAAWAWVFEPTVMVLVGLMAALLVYRHAGNIARLLAGTEPKVGLGRRSEQPAAQALRSGKKRTRQSRR